MVDRPVVENAMSITHTIMYFFTECLPMFQIKISKDLKFLAYHAGVGCYVISLWKNRVTTIDSWSKLEVAVRYLNAMSIDNQKEIVKEQFQVMSPQKVGQKVYEERTIIRAFEYFAIDRSLHSRLRVDYKLPSVKTRSKLTSKVSNIDDDKFLVNIFSNLPEKQQKCIVLVDEVYVKPLLQYHGVNIFGKAANYPDSLATIDLAIMIKCLFGGPAFLVKMIHVFKLDSKFLYE